MDKPLAHQPGQVNSIKQQKFQNKGRGQSENKGKKECIQYASQRGMRGRHARHEQNV